MDALELNGDLCFFPSFFPVETGRSELSVLMPLSTGPAPVPAWPDDEEQPAKSEHRTGSIKRKQSNGSKIASRVSCVEDERDEQTRHEYCSFGLLLYVRKRERRTPDKIARSVSQSSSRASANAYHQHLSLSYRYGGFTQRVIRRLTIDLR